MIRNKIYILLGPPGSGKGTLSAMCVQKFGWIQLSTGNLCRDHIDRKTSIGLQIAEIITQGQLVSDEIVATMVADWLSSQQQLTTGILFDGYPRTKQQASIFYDLLKTKLLNFDAVLIQLCVDTDLLLKRIAHRVICSNKVCGRVYSSILSGETGSKQSMICDDCSSPLVRRLDDAVESFQQRLEIYFKHEQEIVEFYVDKGFPVCKLNGAQEISKVFEDFKKIAQQNYAC